MYKRQVPKHVRLQHRLCQPEIRTIMQRFNIASVDQFPCISHRDPVARFIGLQPDDLCKISRRNKTSGDFEFYRRCVHDAGQ